MALSLEQFVKQLEDSGILSAEALKGFLPPVMNPKDATELARELVRQKKLTRFQTQLISQGKGASLVLGNYLILEKLGQGGIGQVYKAEHRRMKRLVAIKVLQSQFVKNAQAVERFKREVEAIGRLSHPQIVAAFDADQFHGTHFLVMEYVEGRDLASVVKEDGPLPLGIAVNFIVQAAIGLQYAHEHGVIHRDMKPANLLLARDGNVKLLDLGLARFDDDAAGMHEALTGTGSVMGTVDFMSPEQCVNTRHADARSDIYSLGCTLFNLLTGRMVYAGETVVEKIFAHRDAAIPSLRSVRPDLPESIDVVVRKMLAKNPGERYQTAAEVAFVLQQLSIPAALVGSNYLQGSVQIPGTSSPGSGWDTPAFPPATPLSTPTLNSAMSDTATSPGMVPSNNPSDAGRTANPGGSPKKSGRSLGQWRIVGLTGAALLLFVVAIAFWPRGTGKPTGKSTISKSTRLKVRKSEETSPLFVKNAAPNAPESTGTPDKSSPPMVADSAPATAAPGTPAPAGTPAVVPVAQEGRTLIVGVGPGEFGDLTMAFGQAQPGDTILIRHRGPLEFSPVDLTGKTPLTIMGDAKDGVDYWPIVRQVVAPTPDPSTPLPTAAFWGDQVNLTFRKVHLVLGGLKRLPLASFVQAAKGKLELTDCTLTVSALVDPGALPGEPVALVRHSGTSGQVFDVTLKRTFLRGERLQQCVAAVSGGDLSVDCEQMGWSGGQSYWLQATDARSKIRVKLEHSTLYNFKGFLDAALQPPAMPSADPRIDIVWERCVLAGRYPAAENLFRDSTSETQDFEASTRAGEVQYQISGTVFHRVRPYFKAATENEPGSLSEFLALNGAPAEAAAFEVDPLFRVRPVREMLDETLPRDLQARLTRLGRKLPEGIPPDVGIDPMALPTTLAIVAARQYAESNEVARTPRGKPRILRVHQKSGDYKTIEDAFDAARGDDIIEIADDGPYVPHRDFGIAGKPARSLFASQAAHISLRAAEGAEPVVILTEKDQSGPLPPLDPNVPGNPHLTLWHNAVDADSGRSFQVDGVHFRARMNPDIPHCFFHFYIIPYLRFTNCSFVSGPGKHFGSPCVNAFLYVPRVWFENDAFFAPVPPTESFIGHSTTHHDMADNDQVVYLENCLFGGPAFRRHPNNKSRKLQLVAEHNTFGSSPFYLSTMTTVEFVANENLIVTETVPIESHSGSLQSVFQSGGVRNALWIGTRPISAKDRDTGVMGLLPGPALKSLPAPEGPGTLKDPYRRYRLKKGQLGVTLALDGGPVGIRSEYLPPLPMMPLDQIQRR